MDKQNNKLSRVRHIFFSSLQAKTILQAILVGLITGIVVVLFKISISGLFEFIQNSISNFDFLHKLFILPLITSMFLFVTMHNGLVHRVLQCLAHCLSVG